MDPSLPSTYGVGQISAQFTASYPLAGHQTPPLRIGIIAPPWLPVPPQAYGGTENILDTLAQGLQNRGHEVVLFTTGDSTCPVQRRFIHERAIGVGLGSSVDEIRHVLYAYDNLEDIDIVHDHTLVGPLYSAAMPKVAVVTTNHGPFNANLIDFYRKISDRVGVIAISEHQASTAQGVALAGIIHHGVDIADFPAGGGQGGYAAFLGRMHPGKAPHLAVEIAREAGYPLVIAAKMQEPDERAYFESMVKPLLGGNITYVGELDRTAKLELLGNATCLLNPILWPEPFGMVMLEALACGTPVITSRYGAAPEIVEDGVVGFVRTETDGFVEALHNIGYIDRGACRRRVQERFSAQGMVDAHLEVYRRQLGIQRVGPLELPEAV